MGFPIHAGLDPRGETTTANGPTKLTPQDARRLATAANCSPSTVARAYDGHAPRPIRDAIAAAAERLRLPAPPRTRKP